MASRPPAVDTDEWEDISDEWESVPPENVGGLYGAVRGAETIAETPWYSKNYMGLPSVTQAMRALPAVGGLVGGALASPGIVTTAGGAALGGAGGEALRQHLTRSIGGRGPATSVEAALGIGKEAGIQAGAQAAGGLIAKGLAGGGRALMQSAAKPAVSALKEYGTTAPKVVQTLLDEGINVTPGGLEKLQGILSRTNAEIREAVASAPGHIPKERVAARVLPTAQRVSQQVNPQAALKDIGEAVEQFLSHPTLKGPLTIPEAQAMKVGTYAQIGKKYGEISSASVEAQKALARGLKEEVAAEVPKIAGLNAKEARILAAQEVVGRRVALSGNRDPVGFAWVTSHPTTFLAALIDRSPVIKSMLARGMYQSAGKAGKVSPQLIRAAVIVLAGGDPNSGAGSEGSGPVLP